MIVIIDYGMGNLSSVVKALVRLDINAVVSSDKKDIQKADKLILPGVGFYAYGIRNLKKLNLLKTLNKKVLKDKTPILGICLGMQLFTNWGEEGNVKGLSWIKGKTIRFVSPKEKSATWRIKIPHMGWNSPEVKKNSPLLAKIPQDAAFYFVHSYHVVCEDKKDILATTNYGLPFTSMVQKENIYGVQFHPEKSHKNGLTILKNFVENT